MSIFVVFMSYMAILLALPPVASLSITIMLLVTAFLIKEGWL